MNCSFLGSEGLCIISAVCIKSPRLDRIRTGARFQAAVDSGQAKAPAYDGKGFYENTKLVRVGLFGSRLFLTTAGMRAEFQNSFYQPLMVYVRLPSCSVHSPFRPFRPPFRRFSSLSFLS